MTEPLLTRSTVVTAISALSALLVKTGGGNVSVWLAQNSDSIALIVLTAAPLVTALLSRRHVTPLAAPQANDGTRLVPAGSVASFAPSTEPTGVTASAVFAVADSVG